MSDPGRPFASLQWLSIWYKQEPRASEQEQELSSNTEHAAEVPETAPKDGLLYFETSQQDSKEDVQRCFGLAQGLLDFVRMLSKPGAQIKSVQTSQSRLLYLQPEAGFYLVAKVALPRRQSASKSLQPTDEGLDDEVLRESIQQSCNLFHLLHGPMSSLAQQGQWRLLMDKIATYFHPCMISWNTQFKSLGALDFPLHLDVSPASYKTSHLPSLAEFAEKYTCTLAYFQHQQLLCQAGTTCSSQAFTCLTRHLSSQFPNPAPVPSESDYARARTQNHRSSSGSGWTSALGVNQLGSYLTVPNLSMPNITMSADQSTATGRREGASSESDRKGKQRASSSGWQQVMSWDALKRPFGSAINLASSNSAAGSSSQSQEAPQEDDTETGSDSDESVAEHITRLAEKRAPAEEGQVEEAAEDQAEAVDGDAISEALSSDMASAAIESPVKQLDVVRIYDWASYPPAWRTVQTLRYAATSMVMIHSDELSESDMDAALQDARSLMTTLVVPPRPERLSQYRYAVVDRSSGIAQEASWPTSDERWSGSLASSKEADAVSALLQGQSNFSDSTSHVSQTIVRTGTNQWALSKRTDDGTKDLYLLLPRQFGKEGSLVDAVAELEKLEIAANR